MVIPLGTGIYRFQVLRDFFRQLYVDIYTGILKHTAQKTCVFVWFLTYFFSSSVRTVGIQ